MAEKGFIAWGVSALKSVFAPAPAPAPAPQGQLVIPSARLDGFRQTVADALDLRRLSALLRSADSGRLSDGLLLFEEMEQKDANLRSVADTRRLALTGLDWEVVSAADEQAEGIDRTLADEAAVRVREVLGNLASFDEALEHLSTGIGPNLAVLELVWDAMNLARLVPVPSWRLVSDGSQPGVVRVITDQNLDGIPATSPKFVVHHPHGGGGHGPSGFFPFTKALTRPQAFLHLVKQFATIDWGTFCTIFGMPIRVATYDASATPEEKDTVLDMLQNLGTNACAMFSKAVTLEMKESSQRGTAPYETIIAYCGREQAKLFLGGNLTSDTTGGTGTLAAGAVQNEVRQDLRDDDIRRESRTVERQIIAPLCKTLFPGQTVPCPKFRRVKPETIDRVREAELLLKAQQLGAKIPLKHALAQLGIPELQDGEIALEPGLDAFGAGLGNEMMPNREATPGDSLIHAGEEK